MDFHVIAGLTAPILIAFHASFKFQGIAGFSFWIMVAVAISGVIGRYLYGQIPRSLNAAELSLTELKARESDLSNALIDQMIFSVEDLNHALQVPAAAHIRKIGPLFAICEMIALDALLPFRVARLRRGVPGVRARLRSVGGLLSCGNAEIEDVVQLIRNKVTLSKRVVFLDQTHRVFHLWHVIHRPFSYAFAVLAIFHIVVATGFGFLGLVIR
jgi:hypothetical protein